MRMDVNDIVGCCVTSIKVVGRKLCIASRRGAHDVSIDKKRRACLNGKK
jgi:hypothetical protein